MLIDVSELIEDPDFASEYIVYRCTGKWMDGRFFPGEPERLEYFGAAQPASAFDLKQYGIGDDEQGVMKFFCRAPKVLHLTRNIDDESAQISDEIVYCGNLYKVVRVSPWNPNGWMRAFASLKGGAG